MKIARLLAAYIALLLASSEAITILFPPPLWNELAILSGLFLALLFWPPILRAAGFGVKR